MTLVSYGGTVEVSNISGPDTVSIGTYLSNDHTAVIFSITKTKKGVGVSIREQFKSI